MSARPLSAGVSSFPFLPWHPAPMQAAIRLDPVVKTEVYDGPMELLLYLVRRDGIDLFHLPIAHITREYLAFLDEIENLDLDVAGEFLVMAATLCELKSREMLPRAIRTDDSVDEEDPAQELARRIIEYQRYREAADGLERRLWLDRDVFRRDYAPPPDPAALHIEPGVDAFGLLEAFHAVVQRSLRARPVHEVKREQFRWVDCVRWVLDRLDDGEPHTLDELLADLPSRAGRVITFLAVLELCKLRMVDVQQRTHLAPVLVQGRVQAHEADLSLFEDAS